MNQVMSGAQAIVECLKLEEIDRLFCVPGESYLALLDALYDAGGIELVSARHEGGASFMAEAYGKATKKPGVVMATRGVGAANLSIGVHTAYQDSTPLVVFLGQVDSKFRGREGFQEVELDQFFQHMSKWSVEVTDVERMPELVQRAFRIAKSGRPGPVIVSLPADILTQEAMMTFGPVSSKNKPLPAAEEIERCIHMLAQAQKPLIIAGGGAILSDAEDDLVAFAEQTGIPVLASFRRHDVFPNTHALYVGHSGLGTFAGILETVRQADTILAIGTRFSEITTQGYSIISEKQTLIHIDIDHATLGKVYAPHLGIIADARQALQVLRQAWDGNSNQPANWRDWAGERRKVYEQLTSIGEADETSKVDMKQIIKSLQKVLPQDAVLTNDAGNFSGWLHSFYQFTHKKTYIGPTSGAMGYGLPAAIAAKMAFPEKVVVSLSGDGGFMMTVQELETAVRYNAPIIALLFNNNMYGTIRMHQEISYPGRVIGTSLGNPDFSLLGKSFGLLTLRVESNSQFEEALQTAISANKPALIEVICDPEKISVTSTITSIREKHTHKGMVKK